jgi:hypothetical protein
MANGRLLNRIRDTGRSPALEHIKVGINTGKFSKRMVNILKEGVNKGYVSCGIDTGNMLQEFASAYGFKVSVFHKSYWYTNHVYPEAIDPEKLPELLAYLKACQAVAPSNGFNNGWLDRVVNQYQNGDKIEWIPLPKQSGNFDYLEQWMAKPTEEELAGKQRFIDDLENGRVIEIVYTP